MSAPQPSAIPHTAPLALTMGDPAGIGLDITLAAWWERGLRALSPFVLFGDPDALAARARLLGLDVPIMVVAHPSEGPKVFDTHLPVWPVPCATPVVPGQADPRNGPVVVAAIEAAVLAVREGVANAVVTNPVAKSVLAAHGFPYPGHTDFLGALAETHFGTAGVRPVMLLASAELRIVPLTVHIPLTRVAGAISAGSIIATAGILNRALIRDFGIPVPRIAVAGLNPHAGEDGTLGEEEKRIIAPAIAVLQREGVGVFGPDPADTLFHPAARANYDAVLAMYHDQALIPIKTLAFDSAVNVTLGLPFVRTSPDHGTAFSLAGTGAARATSLIEALKVADRIAARRLEAGEAVR